LPNRKHPNYTALYQLLTNKKNEIEAYELSLINQRGELTPDLLSVLVTGTKDDFITFSENFVADELKAKRISKKNSDKI
jgi:hypothetical protein